MAIEFFQKKTIFLLHPFDFLKIVDFFENCRLKKIIKKKEFFKKNHQKKEFFKKKYQKKIIKKKEFKKQQKKIISKKNIFFHLD